MNSVSKYKEGFAQFQASYDEQSFIINKKRKAKLFHDLRGKVLELGPGTGVNFKFLDGDRIEWLGIEPNPAMHRFLFDAAKQQNISASLLECDSESICLSDNTIDFVISTEVLCSVNSMPDTLNEIRRVLKPGGKFLFLEHVIDKKNRLRRTVQRAVPHTPWKCYSDGCDPGRDIASEIENTGFKEVVCMDYMQEGSGIINMINKPHIYGWAVK